jgi:hypothetical protein
VNNTNGPAASTSTDGEIVWRPPMRVQATAMHRFATAVMTSGATPSADIVSVARLAHTPNGKRLEVPAKKLLAGAPLTEVLDINAVDDPDALRLLAATAAEWRTSRASSD